MSADLKQFEKKMDGSIEYLNEEFRAMRAGRANPAVLDKITVDYYGVATPIPQVGNVSVPDPRSIMIQPWDATLLSNIEKAISASDLGINPQNDGKTIRLNFPALTEERRKEMVKNISKKAEDTKVHIRNARRDAIEHFKKSQKNGEITEDDLKGVEADVQKLTDKKIKEIDEIAKKKEKEILEV